MLGRGFRLNGEAKQGCCELVLMDIQLVVMNGFEATQATRALDYPTKASVPVVAMTSNAFDRVKKRALDTSM